jgi:5-(aminomethyl)-3-furanmethanol phosphate kinase
MDAIVVKIGGSLAMQPDKLKDLCVKLGEASKTHRLIVVPGGGEFADIVRIYDKEFELPQKISHRMAILAMDQYGLLLSALVPRSVVVNKFEDLSEGITPHRLVVFLPSNFLFCDNSLNNSWDVTSDSIAVYVAQKLGISKTVLVTDVDGIFTRNPKKFSDANLLPKLSARDLLTMSERTSVDLFLPNLLLIQQVECFVVNGLNPERVISILDGKETLCTKIS